MPPRATAPPLDCRTCGACCVPELKLPFYVGVTERDLARLTPRFRSRNVARGSILTKVDRVGHCVCVALQGTVGRRVNCTIYERRPDACRQLEAGRRACHKARRQAGLE
jgi:Fe-S-cluster containining protein